MDENLLVVADGLVSFRGILATTVEEEACADGLPDLRVVFLAATAATTRDHRQTEPIHDLDQLFAHVLAALHRPGLNEVLIAPLVGESVHFPSFVHRQHRQMVSIFVVKFGTLLIGQLLLLTRSVEDILD